MNKAIIFVILLFTTVTFPQAAQTIDSINEPIKEVVTHQPKKVADTINSALVPLNKEDLIHRTLNENFRERYSGTSFDYEVKDESGFLSRLRGWWRRLLDWLSPEATETTKVMDELFNILLVFLAFIAFGFLLYYLNKKGFVKL